MVIDVVWLQTGLLFPLECSVSVCVHVCVHFHFACLRNRHWRHLGPFAHKSGGKNHSAERKTTLKKG